MKQHIVLANDPKIKNKKPKANQIEKMFKMWNKLFKR